MKNLFVSALLGIAVLSAFPKPALAARTGASVAITDITIVGTGDKARLLITAGVAGTAPACGLAKPNEFAIDLATNKGRSIINLATAAMLSGKSVNVAGLETCLLVGGTYYQTLDLITLNP
jgi:hypothetical protein